MADIFNIDPQVLHRLGQEIALGLDRAKNGEAQSGYVSVTKHQIVAAILLERFLDLPPPMKRLKEARLGAMAVLSSPVFSAFQGLAPDEMTQAYRRWLVGEDSGEERAPLYSLAPGFRGSAPEVAIASVRALAYQCLE